MKRIRKIRERLEITITAIVLLALMYMALTDGKYYYIAVCLVGLSLVVFVIVMHVVWRCPYCHKELPHEKDKCTFCPNCGHVLDAEE